MRMNQSDTGVTLWPLRDERLAHGRGHAALDPHLVRDVARIDGPGHEARPLDRLLDLHAVVERVGERLGVEHRLPVAAHVGVAQHRLVARA